MKRKLMAVLLGTVLSMAVLAGCGGGDKASSEASQPANAAVEETAEEETQDAAEEVTEDAVETEVDYSAVFPYGFMGVSEGGSTLYWLTTEAVDYGIFVELEADTTQYFAMVGPIMDNGDGTLTITDEQTGVAFTVMVEEVQDEAGDSGLLLTTEEGTEALLGPSDANEVMAIMLEIEEVATGIELGMGSSEAAAGDAAGAAEDILSVLTVGLAGEGDDGSYLYWATDENGTVGILAMVSADGTQYMCFAGEILDNGDGTITVTDAETGLGIDFGLESDGTNLYLTIEDSVAALAEVPVEDVIGAIESILASAE